MNIDSIKNGIVIDHIEAKKGLEIYKILKLEELDCSVAIITNARSKKMGKKDIIKIDKNIDLDFDILGYLDPNITVNIIKDDKRVDVVCEIEDSIFYSGDYQWEFEALSNIIKNAIEHSKSGNKIEIKAIENALYTKIIIKDYGVGMTKKDLKNIFKRFYKGENSNNDSIGIGLNLAKNIIEKDGGYIKVDSIKDEGTTFEIKYMK